MGNFSDGEIVEFFLPKDLLDFSGQNNGHGGFAPTPNGVRTNAVTMWRYTFAIYMGVVVDRVQNEVSLLSHRQMHFRDVTALAPAIADFPGSGFIRPTLNICGWEINTPEPLHSSWRSTYASLGWHRDRLPPDVITDWQISPNSLRWVSDRLESIPDYRTTSAGDLCSTLSGHYIQSHRFVPPSADLIGLVPMQTDRYSRRVHFALESARPVSADLISPSFAFAMRIERRSPSGTHLGLAAPWYPIARNGNHVDLPVHSRLAQNGHINIAPQSMNITAFSTASERRSNLLPFLYV